MNKDYYKILGVSESAGVDEIKKTYRRLAKQYHPDRNKGDKQAEEKFKEISEAFHVLSDPKKKEEYDTFRKYGAYASHGVGGNGSSFNFADLSHLFKQGRGGLNGSSFEFHSGGFGSLDDILSGLFSRGQSNRSPFGQRMSPRKGQDLNAEISVSFMDTLNGSEQFISLSNGKRMKVRIPRGIEDGAKIRLAGQGMPGYNNGQNGDLIITVRVMTDQNFKRDGNDIHTSVTISFVDAIKGCKVKARTLTRTIMLSVPPGTQPGTKLRLKGLGLDVNGQQGDQFVEIKVEIPKNLSAKQKKIIDEWEE